MNRELKKGYQLAHKALTITQITRKVDNIISNHLLTLSLSTHIGTMPLSLETQILITKRNYITCQIRALLKRDRRAYIKSTNIHKNNP